MRKLQSTLLIGFVILVLVAIVVLNYMLLDGAYNACISRGSSPAWCRMTEGWQLFRYMFGF